MLIWMSTGLPFNTAFSHMKRPNPDNNGLDNEDLKMNARPELPIARKKRCDSAEIWYTHIRLYRLPGYLSRDAGMLYTRDHTQLLIMTTTVLRFIFSGARVVPGTDASRSRRPTWTGWRPTVLTWRISFANRPGVIITTTGRFRCPPARGKLQVRIIRQDLVEMYFQYTCINPRQIPISIPRTNTDRIISERFSQFISFTT